MRDFKLRRRFNKLVKDGGAGGGGAGGKTIVLDDIPVKTVTDGSNVYSSNSTNLKATINGEEASFSAPVYFYDVSLGDVVEETVNGGTRHTMITSLDKAVVDSNAKSIAKTGDTNLRILLGAWWLTKGTICTANEKTFVSSDAVIEYRQ